MDLDFLKEYEKREFDAFQIEGNVSKRIGELKSPIVHITGPCSSIWSQISFSGTVIFPLHPLPKECFERGWRISVDSFPSLIEFVEETKKIQFVLTAPPTAYEEYDYLEPLLTRLSPPLYTQIGGDNEELNRMKSKCNDEIKFLMRFSSHWQFLSMTYGGKHIIEDYINSYALIRHLGFNDIADIFIDNFLAEPQFATDYLTTAYDLLVDPIIDPFNAAPSYCIEKIRKASEMKISTPYVGAFPEIGSMLMRKCTHYPESLTACKFLIDRYEENDLYSVSDALTTAVSNRNQTKIINITESIDEILDNIWTDKTIIRYETLMKHEIDITLGIVGFCLAGPTGLLASLGVRLADRDNYIDKFSELIARNAASPYLATIHDFKRKYRIM